ncbi:hypothetical protein [Mycolicibacterium sp. lyk4-40-TYG-92]|uniref:hypothetical protein n=1 Tax=Mycolicibacterium sp. lyk4-40-TYG-92 TaxID=3040295 RepID=UPI00254FEFE6|nr:hypothetical protein [Mycolicibacterium sp. lyk4-40-TYG-92]
MTRQLASRWVLALLAVCFVCLIAAFMTVPAVVSHAVYAGVGDRSSLPVGVATGLDDFWRSGRSSFPADLGQIVDYWRIWHAVKIAISGLAMVVLIMLTVGLWRRYAMTTGQTKVLAWTAGVPTILVIAAGGVLAVNIQSTAAPSIALMPMLEEAPARGDLTSTRDEMRIGLTDDSSAESRTPALHTLIGDVAVYHWALTGTALLLAVVSCSAAVASWRRRRSAIHTGTRARVACTAIGGIMFVASLLYLTLAFYSLVSALDPAGALLDLIG